MADKVEETPCPGCKQVGTLVLIPEKLVAKPLGTWSLSGAQMKTSAYVAPVIECGNCNWQAVGRYVTEKGGTYAVFDNPDSGSAQ